MFRIALACFLLAAALAQIPKPCPGPTKFETRFRRYDRERHYMVLGNMVYDGDNKRIKEFEDITLDDTKVALLKLKLYTENKEYRVDLKTRKCNITVPRHAFHPYGVPQDGQYHFEALIGAAGLQGESVTVAGFAAKINSTDMDALVTEPHCFPVNDVFFDTDGMEITSFYDMKEGISDPMAFDIPKECQSLV